MPEIFVHLLPSLIPPGALVGGVAVVVDVLRATTVMVHALAAGCEAIIPCLEIEDARRAAAELPRGQALLGGERQGLPIEGFDLGNSPASYTPDVCRGKTLVMTTTNGTRAILASLEAERVLVASYPNLMETWGTLNREGRPIHIVCAGTDGRISLEDTLLAGDLVLNLAGWQGGVSHWSDITKNAACNDQALLASAAAWDSCDQFHSPARSLARILASGRGGRRVTEIGLADDIKSAASRKPIKLVAELRRDPLRIVSTGQE